MRTISVDISKVILFFLLGVLFTSGKIDFWIVVLFFFAALELKFTKRLA
jgi:hypothetical protein